MIYVRAVCSVDERGGCKDLALDSVFVDVRHPGLHLAASNGYSVDSVILGDAVLIAAFTGLTCIYAAGNVCVDARVDSLGESHSLGNGGVFTKLRRADEDEHSAL